MTKREYWIWLCGIQGISALDIDKLLKEYETPEEIYKQSPIDLEDKGLLAPELAKQMMAAKEEGAFGRFVKYLEDQEINFVCPEDDNFPERLMNMPERPYGLFYKGNLPDADVPTCGMVGARAASLYGREMAEIFAGKLAKGGVQIVSGMALGIDGISQRAAVDSGGRSFAVLGCGVDIIYPANNTNLYYEILEGGGGIISEYTPGTPPLPRHFPARNRIISALSDRLLVIEAKKRSGTSITVRYALEQGRDVYALPGRVNDPLSEGCNQMIADGAGVLIDPEYLLDEIFPSKKTSDKEIEGQMSIEECSPVFAVIKKGPASLQEIITSTQKEARAVTAELMELEISGLIKEVSQNYYILNKE